MASRRSAPAPVGKPTIDGSQAILMLSEHVESARKLPPGDRSAYHVWLTQARHWIAAAFGENSQNCAAFEMAGPPGMVLAAYASPAEIERHFNEEVEAKVGQLQAFVSVLEKAAAMTPRLGALVAKAPGTPPGVGRKVFVVHGHDEGAKEGVARYLEKLHLEPVILHEQPNRGMTIIEKFETFSDVAFAVVLLTPDDPGVAGGQARARQNVILELGYFLGKLGRACVCALYKDGTEIPSDFQGVVFVKMDPAGGWRMQLALELKQVLPHVDLNKAVET
jgi:predicted nucleotide-binding protein